MTYETNKEIPTLSKVRRKERDEYEKKINKEAKELLLKAVSYYDENYPNSIHENIWKKPKIKIEIGNGTLKGELKSLTEEELRSLYEIFTYFHDERQMPKVEEHTLRSKVLVIVRRLVPGGTFLDQLYELYDKRKKINKEIKKLEDNLDKERKEFLERLEKNKNIKSDIFTCKPCGKVCKSPAGLKSHQRNKHPEMFENKNED